MSDINDEGSNKKIIYKVTFINLSIRHFLSSIKHETFLNVIIILFKKHHFVNSRYEYSRF